MSRIVLFSVCVLLAACAGKSSDSGPGAAGSAGATSGGSTGTSPCGGFIGDTCSADQYCAYTVGQACGAADASSTCKPRPSACDDVYAPVCGCDGKTYGNDCSAASQGTGVMATGMCK